MCNVLSIVIVGILVLVFVVASFFLQLPPSHPLALLRHFLFLLPVLAVRTECLSYLIHAVIFPLRSSALLAIYVPACLVLHVSWLLFLLPLSWLLFHELL